MALCNLLQLLVIFPACRLCGKGTDLDDSNDNTLEFMPYQCIMCCHQNVTKLYPTRNESEWKYTQTKNVSLLFPECHASSLCDECIMKICCHSNEFMRQCPECRRVINPKYYKRHNITISQEASHVNSVGTYYTDAELYPDAHFLDTGNKTITIIQLILMVLAGQALVLYYCAWIAKLLTII